MQASQRILANRLEERYVREESISRKQQEKFCGSHKAELIKNEQELEARPEIPSNLAPFLDDFVKIASSLQFMWDLGNYRGMQKLQYVVFAEGMVYDRTPNLLLTPRVKRFSALCTK